MALDVTRDNAWTTLTRYTKSESLLRHALAVEASTRWYARHFGEDEELWGCTALLHDFDYEIHPTLDKHPQDGAPILRDEGYPEMLILAVLSHAEHLAIPRETLLQKTLFACDELSGFIHACGLVRPTGLEGLEPKSVRKKLKQPSFAAGVHRDEVYAGAELLGLELDEHIANVVAALQPIAGELGLHFLGRRESLANSASAGRPGVSRASDPERRWQQMRLNGHVFFFNFTFTPSGTQMCAATARSPLLLERVGCERDGVACRERPRSHKHRTPCSAAARVVLGHLGLRPASAPGSRRTKSSLRAAEARHGPPAAARHASQWHTITSRTGPVIVYRTAPQGRSRSSSCGQRRRAVARDRRPTSTSRTTP